MKRNTGVGDLFKVRLEKWCFPGGGGALEYLGWVGAARFFLYPVLEFALKLIPRSRNGPIFYTPF